ncbi:MAG: hypothetical protein A3B66_00425 [Alphaproteobacteria bacterium RIFCSPHIGHO2_02_FULL_46_13]|nr:MAG: hypothetical protein A3B66_00425 [Alphaproteobacteria bacterium RIFCSPHIGHO2_02_FULL_46_13]
MKVFVKNCAIYTRKSTEEGLDMEFNSLDAQREACEAYILSQKAEGWQAVKTHYDDGGYSGGNIERPALKNLIVDIEAGKIDIVVVYKIDRLTRSLMDFSKLVETFDKYGVTFVSITQSFNTTTSMGRLTLNVLLSFAQFEREVIGERVRDKIAASKKKGMWMGGASPIGYRVEGRQLVPDKASADTVQKIYKTYLRLDSVTDVKNELDRLQIKSREWVSKKGIVHPACYFSRGLLYKILRNPIYIGKIAHKNHIYEGQHEPILTQELWDKVQEKLAEHAGKKRGSLNDQQEGNFLKGKLFDQDGNYYSPTYTMKGNKRYRYYINQSVLQFKIKPVGIIDRFPAHELELRIETEIRQYLFHPLKLEQVLNLPNDRYVQQLQLIPKKNDQILKVDLFDFIKKIVVYPERLEIKINVIKLKNLFKAILGVCLPETIGEDIADINIPYEVNRTKAGAILIQPEGASEDILKLPPDRLKRLVQGIAWRQDHFNGKTIRSIAQNNNCSEALVGKLINASLDARSYSL